MPTDKKVKKNIKTIVTHGANFHADDLFGVAATLMYLKKKKPTEKWKVIRSLDPKVWKKADILLDIGFVHDEKKNRFDHHQVGGAGKRESGAPYAAFGLIWKKFGKAIAGSAVLADDVDQELIAGLDSYDNGVDTYTNINEDVSPYLLVHYFKAEAGAEGNKPKEQQDFDKVFMRLIPLAQRVIELAIIKAKRHIEAKKIISKAYEKAKDKRVVISEKYAPRDFNDYPEVLFYIYKNLRGNWAVEAVPVGRGSFANKVSLPKAWRGRRDGELAKICGVADAVFCHSSGFLGGANSKEGAIKMAYLAIEAGETA
jgi:uncharacterized UPF0160 family protein